MRRMIDLHTRVARFKDLAFLLNAFLDAFLPRRARTLLDEAHNAGN
jgi:hypothetical protein